jgi:LuxR family maltose regulon positive regulatory protein
MTPTLLATKFHPPPLPAKRVPREHIIRRLNAGLEAGRQLTLVSAPAGFGKTACVSEWLSGLELPMAWLSLDRSDDDPVRFFTYLLGALQRVEGSLGRELEGAISSGQLPPSETIAAVLIKDLQGSIGKIVLALDDFHVIQDRDVLVVLERLITNGPEQLHLVLATREDPLLPLARLRANNRMTEIRAANLRFTPEEASLFLNEIMELSLSEADVAALESRTEGWVVGLQLAGLALQGALSMQGQPDPAGFIATLSGSHRHILSYLTEEVLSSQPEEIQFFLLQTSILDKLSEDLCAAVTGRADSGSLLERLFKANLFLIPLDDEGRWYRYHHLFADLLRNRQNRIGRDEIAQLHQRASQWYEAAGMPGEAIDHALAGADYPRAAALLEKQALPLTMQGYVKTVEGWLRSIPPEWQSHNPKANLAFAWTHLLRGNYGQVDPYMKAAEAALTAPELAGETSQALKAELYALQANLLHVQGKVAEGRELAYQALQLAPPDNDYLRGLAYVGLGGSYRQEGDYEHSIEAYQKAVQASRAAGHQVVEMLAVTTLALMAIEHGQLRFAAQVGLGMVDRLEGSGSQPSPVAGTIYGALATIYCEWDQLERSSQFLGRAAQLSVLGGHTAALVYLGLIRARLLQAEGELVAAAQALQEAAGLQQRGIPAWLKPELVAQQVRLFLAQGQLLAAEAVLLPYGEILAVEEAQEPAGLLRLAALRLALARGEELQEGSEAAGRLIAAAGRRAGIRLQALLLRAQMLNRLGRVKSALEDLEAALALAEPEGYQRTFTDEGQEMGALLRSLLGRSSRTSYIKKLLAAFPKVAPGLASGLREPVVDAEETLVEPLTGREVEVLRLMAAGLKYEEISRQLIISLNTVRFHVKTTYGKLGVNNRTMAIEKARRLGLL